LAAANTSIAETKLSLHQTPKSCRLLPLVSLSLTHSRKTKISFQSILAEPENDLAKFDKTRHGTNTTPKLFSFLYCDKSPF
jgi:hypothetical protein